MTASENNIDASLVIGYDAYQLGTIIETDRIIDNLIAAGKIRSTFLVLIDQMAEPDSELGYKKTIDFTANELVPFLRQKYDISFDPDDIIAIGSSRRGMVSSTVAFERPDIVGRVISLSGAYYWRPNESLEFEWLTDRFANHSKQPIDFYLSAGALETVVTPKNEGHFMLSTNDNFRNMLIRKGYDFKYNEFMGAHHEVSWQGEIAPALIYHLGNRLDQEREFYSNR